MIEETIDKIKKDFGEDLLNTAVHELSHAIFGALNGYNIKGIVFVKQRVGDKQIDGKAEIDLSTDQNVINDLCSVSFTNTLTTKEKYKEIGTFYIELLLMGYVAESVYLGLKMNFITSLSQPDSGFTTSFDSQVDGARCGVILANNNKCSLGMRRSKKDYYDTVLKIVQNENYKLILEHLLLETFYDVPEEANSKKNKPELENVRIIAGLVKQFEINV